MFAPPGHTAAVMPSPPTLVFTAPMLSASPSVVANSGGRGGEARLLTQHPTDARFNVLVLSGLPWHVSEHAVREYLHSLYRQERPTTVRLYTNPHNGVSRGSCFVEYASMSASASGGGGHHGGRGAGSNGAGDPAGNRGGRAAVPFFMTGGSSGVAGPSSSAAAEGRTVVHLEDLQEVIEATPFEGIPLTVKLYYLTVTRWDREGKLPDLPTSVPLPARRMVTGYGSEGFVVRCGPQLGVANTVTPEGAAQVRKLRKRWRANQRKMDAGQRF